mmetsp:Transcript_16773/g.33087  ORF Transcript_16773/g.33087 Transcript_16773/m.33087 type:complete len:303 (-) Transcript_16773:232-1140(-)
MLRPRMARAVLGSGSRILARGLLSPGAQRSESTGGPGPSAASLNFSFSGCGWLTPWHWGAADGLMSRGLLTQSSLVAGASGGSVAAATVAAGIPIDDCIESFRRQSQLCMKHGTIGRIEPIMREELAAVLTQDGVKAMCERGTIAVTRLKPRPVATPVLISQFSDPDDLIGAILSSCHIPYYLSRSAAQDWRGGSYIDGGFGALIPPIKGYYGVMPFQPSYIPPHLTKGFVRSELLTPALTPSFPFPMHQLVRMAFFPSSDKTITELVLWGKEAANVWADAHEQRQKGGAGLPGVGKGMMGG